MSGNDPMRALVDRYRQSVSDPETAADIARNAREVAAERNRERVARWTARIEAAGAPSNAWYVAQATDRDRPAAGIVRAVLACLEKRRPQEPLLVLLTARPQGFRTLALVRAIAEWNGSARYVRADDLVEQDTRSYKVAEAQSARLEAMIGTSLLAIDDVRPDLPSPLYHDVLVRRFDEGRVTLCVVASGDARDWSKHYLSVRMSRYREADGLKIVGG